MNINKLTKVELINKIDQLKKEKLDIKNNSANKINDKKITVDNKSTLIYDIFLKIKTLILSLTFIGILTQVFKNYKTIRVILKFANYIILGIFGMSMFDAFGLGFIVKFLGELKYILGAGVAYLTDTTFYNYLTKIFNVVEEKDSIRDTYKKSEKIDWKAEFEKVERQREIDKWQAKYEKHNEEGIDKKTILLLLLFLGGSIGAWYYGKDALDLIWGGHTLSNLIKKILRGWRPGDDDEDDDNNNIQLDPDSRAVSPDMLVYASDMVHPKLNEHLPPAPPAPPVASSSNLENPAHTEQGPPNSLLDQIKRGKSLKKAITKESSNEFAGKEVIKKSNPLIEAMSTGLDKMRTAVDGVENEGEIPIDGSDWDNKGDITPTQSIILDKGKGKAKKFLDVISREEDKVMSPSKIANILSDIVKKFPNLSPETLEKLSTVEGLKNRKEIIESLSEDELKTNNSPLNFLSDNIENKKDIRDMSEKDIVKMNKIIQNSLNSDSEKVVEKLNTELPAYKFDVNSYTKLFMEATEAEINSGKTDFDKDKIKKEILEADLVELQNTGGSSDIKKIRNVIRENYTHNSMLNDIKNMKKRDYVDELKMLEVEKEIYNNRGELERILDKSKNLQSLEDLSVSERENLESESFKLHPDKLIDNLKHRSDYAEDSYIDSVITASVDNHIKELWIANPKWSKQQLIEKLIQDNPENKNKILSIVTKTMNQELEQWKNKYSEKEFNKIKEVLQREDLKELESLSENRSEDQIRTLASVNQSHINLLNEIKIKASLASLRKEANEKIKASNENTSNSINQIDNTMNLFDLL